jgi:hypothetical protein
MVSYKKKSAPRMAFKRSKGSPIQNKVLME